MRLSAGSYHYTSHLGSTLRRYCTYIYTVCRVAHVSARADCALLLPCRHDNYVTASAFHPKNIQHFVSACYDGKIRLWRCADPAGVRDWAQTQNDSVTCLTFNTAGDRVLVGTNQGKFRVFSVSNSMKLEFVDEVGTPPMPSLSLSFLDSEGYRYGRILNSLSKFDSNGTRSQKSSLCWGDCPNNVLIFV